ncbi:MAG: hypothetical protein ACT4O3_04545 [Elusimicrobiota bacterium]
MNRIILLSAGFVLGAVASAQAEARTGSVYAVEAELAGTAGFSPVSDADSGLRAGVTAGYAFGHTMTSPGGFSASPGIWGGGPLYFSHETQAVLPFGSADQPSKITISSHAVPMDFLIFTSANPVSRPLGVSPDVIREATANLAKAQSPYVKPLEDRVWEILIQYVNGERHAARFATQAVLTLPYSDANKDGLVDGTNPPVRAETLSIWWLDEEHRLWVKLPDSRVDSRARTVSAPIRALAVFAVMGAPSFKVSDAYAFPSPWRPSGPNAGLGAGQTGTEAGGITFTNLPSEGRIRVYTLSGVLVRDIHHNDGTPQAKWDGKNEAGDNVATGTYIYAVESAGATKTGKLVIVR